MIRCFNIDSNEWDSALSSFRYDFHHLRGYVRLSLNPGDEGLAFYVESNGNRLLLPLVLSRCANGLFSNICDASSPYGYSSPLLSLAESKEAQHAFLNSALELVFAELRLRGCVSLFVRMHPLLPLPSEPLSQKGTLVFHGKTVSVDLLKTEEEIWAATDANDRRRIKKLANAGGVAMVDPDWKHLDEFHAAYSATMTKLNASTSYFFPKEYFLRLRDLDPERFHLVLVKSREGAVMWGGVFSEFNGIVQFHLSGTNPDFEAMSPTKLALHFVRTWARQRGNAVFHLGGGLGGREDSLFDSKRRMGTDLHPFHTWRAVVHPERFEALYQSWQKETGRSATEFFPPYRAPRF